MPVVRIETAADPRLADYAVISDGDRKRRQGLFVAEGRFVVRRLLEGRFAVRSALLTEAALADLERVLTPFLPSLPVFLVSKEEMHQITGFEFHQGCLALGERPTHPTDLGELLGGSRRLVVLEGVTHADNVGAVFRNAAAFACDAVVLDRACADPLYREAIRVSMAATLQTPFARAESWPADLDRIRAAGFTIAALTPRRDAIRLRETPRIPRLALLAGNEGSGLSETALARADLAIRIPIAPTIDSLNVAAATAIALSVLAGDELD